MELTLKGRRAGRDRLTSQVPISRVVRKEGLISGGFPRGGWSRLSLGKIVPFWKSPLGIKRGAAHIGIGLRHRKSPGERRRFLGSPGSSETRADD